MKRFLTLLVDYLADRVMAKMEKQEVIPTPTSLSLIPTVWELPKHYAENCPYGE